MEKLLSLASERAMWIPFRDQVRCRFEVHLHVDFGLQFGRLADLVQLLAKSRALITDLQVDRCLYHYALPEQSAEVKFRVKTARQKADILRELRIDGFIYKEISNPMQRAGTAANRFWR
jgi:hypothetical protein